MSEIERHPDLAELDGLRTCEASRETAAHVRSCPTCQAALDEISALNSRVQASYALPSGQVSAGTDRAVLAAIAARAKQIHAARHRWLVWASGAAAAAALIIAVFVWNLPNRSKQADQAPSASYAEAVNKAANVERKFDIVDVYLMDRRLKTGGGEFSAAWDYNNDGRVDWRDVDALARKVVAVNDRRGGSL
ncbi:MAG: hypothetical protein HZA50_15995 [Planctomycetes bacterium]|nr:hypothetical protein [Planctomycetota bacterium]